jgi:hypothetical protein
MLKNNSGKPSEIASYTIIVAVIVLCLAGAALIFMAHQNSLVFGR